MLSRCMPKSTDGKVSTIEQKPWQDEAITTIHLSLNGKGAEAHYHAAEAACQTTTATDVMVIQDGDLSILA